MTETVLAKAQSCIVSVTNAQEELQPLSPLLDSAEVLLNVESVIAGYKKRLGELGGIAETGRKQAQVLMQKVQGMIATAGQTLQDLITKRQRDSKTLYSKAAAMETLYTQVRTESQQTVKTLHAALKEETADMATNFDQRLSDERTSLTSHLEKLKLTQISAIKSARAAAKKASVELLEYSRENSEQLWILKSSTPMSQNSRLSSEDAKATILIEVTSRLTKGMQSMKDHLESKCGALSSKYSDELRKLKGEVESARERILGRREETVSPVEENPVNKLTMLNTEVRKLLNRIGAFCGKALVGITESTKSIKRSLTQVDQEGISEQGQILLREAKKQLEVCQKQLSDIATKLKSDFYGVQEALNEGKMIVLAKTGKLVTEQRPGFDVQKDLRVRLEKEVEDT